MNGFAAENVESGHDIPDMNMISGESSSKELPLKEIQSEDNIALENELNSAKEV